MNEFWFYVFLLKASVGQMDGRARPNSTKPSNSINKEDSTTAMDRNNPPAVRHSVHRHHVRLAYGLWGEGLVWLIPAMV